jgi:hypothetical protein
VSAFAFRGPTDFSFECGVLKLCNDCAYGTPGGDVADKSDMINGEYVREHLYPPYITIMSVDDPTFA